MDTQKANFQQELGARIVDDLLLNCENSNTEKISRDFDGKSIRDTYFDCQNFIHEKMNIKVDQVEAHSSFGGVGYAYSLHTEEHFVKPEFVLPEELGIKVESKEEDQPYNEVSQNKVINTYVKSEPITSESEADEPVKRLQNSNISEDTIKKESCAETKFLIHREIDIKTEDEGNDQSGTRPSSNTDSLNGFSQTSSSPVEPPAFKCFNCCYQTHQRKCILHHVRKHKEVTFKCPHCPYKTWNTCYLKKHQLVHATEHETELHKCPECPFTSKRKSNVTKHLLVHRDFNEITWFHCPECPYKTKRKLNLTYTHMLKHKKDVVMHKCTCCSYESPRKYTLNRHMRQKHGSKDSEMMGCPQEGCLFKTREKSNLTRHITVWHQYSKIYKCFNCFFQTEYEQEFKAHQLEHQQLDECFSCPLCPYKTTNESCLNNHLQEHKSDNAIEWYHCSECSFKTKRKHNLNQHKMRHNQVLEKPFECSECPYKSPIALYFRRHLVKHQDPASKTWFQCPQCPYRANVRSHLKLHYNTHKTADEIEEWFRCPTCPYKSHSKFYLRKHQLVHKKPDEIANWYYCYICMWKTHSKANLGKHIIALHRDAKGRICNDFQVKDK